MPGATALSLLPTSVLPRAIQQRPSRQQSRPTFSEILVPPLSSKPGRPQSHKNLDSASRPATIWQRGAGLESAPQNVAPGLWSGFVPARRVRPPHGLTAPRASAQRSWRGSGPCSRNHTLWRRLLARSIDLAVRHSPKEPGRNTSQRSPDLGARLERLRAGPFGQTIETAQPFLQAQIGTR